MSAGPRKGRKETRELPVESVPLSSVEGVAERAEARLDLGAGALGAAAKALARRPLALQALGPREEAHRPVKLDGVSLGVRPDRHRELRVGDRLRRDSHIAAAAHEQTSQGSAEDTPRETRKGTQTDRTERR